MKVIFKKLSEPEFANCHASTIFFENIYSKCFGVLCCDLNCFKFGWRSELIDPSIKKIEENIFSLGIDQSFAIIDFTTNSVVFDLSLAYNFHDILNHKTHIAVCTEFEIILINKDRYEVEEIIQLPDFFEDGTIINDKIKIICSDQTVVEKSISQKV
ncbi:MAG: hypothetical protein RLZZ546_3013 [Bacteroidota bacterium]